jgi:homoserine O-acetyltransferase
VQTRRVTLFGPPDVLQLECGRTLGPIDVAYETYGALSPARDNAVLVFHALSGDAHAAGRHTPQDKHPGWWDVMIGPGKGLDTDRYFVICANVLGGCKGTTGPSSINPATGKPWGLDFPVITVEDMVKVHKGLIDHLGIKKLLAVMGGSMGGMQVLEWAVRYPDSVVAAIAIATTPRLNTQSIAFDAVGRNAILADANFAHGNYHGGAGPAQGLAIARMVGHITYLSEEGMHEKFGRELRNADRYLYDFTSEFSVETYLDHQGRTFVERFDANSYLYITKAMDYYDLTARAGSLEAAFRDVQARFLAISFASDWLFTPQQSQQIVAALVAAGKTVSYHNVDSPYGHDAFLLEPERLGRLIRAQLASAAGRPVRGDGAGPPEADPLPARGPGYRNSVGHLRRDYQRIEELIAPGSRVLDLGCGNGALLSGLRRAKQAFVMGVELDPEGAMECLERGLPIIHGDVETELPKLATSSYDYVVLSQTLQTLRRPDFVLDEMLRIGAVCIVSFPNCAYWRRRLKLLGGRAPVSGSGDFPWYATPNLRELSIRDFVGFCRERGVVIQKQTSLGARGRGQVRVWPNLLAEEAIFVLSRENRPQPPAGHSEPHSGEESGRIVR